MKYNFSRFEKALISVMSCGYLVKRGVEDVQWKDNDGHIIAKYYGNLFGELELDKLVMVEELKKYL